VIDAVWRDVRYFPSRAARSRRWMDSRSVCRGERGCNLGRPGRCRRHARRQRCPPNSIASSEGYRASELILRDTRFCRRRPDSSTRLNFAKGCYIGQEIWSESGSRGNVHRMFTGFEVQGHPVEELPAPGTKVRANDKGCGRDNQRGADSVSEWPSGRWRSATRGAKSHFPAPQC